MDDLFKTIDSAYGNLEKWNIMTEYCNSTDFNIPLLSVADSRNLFDSSELEELLLPSYCVVAGGFINSVINPNANSRQRSFHNDTLIAKCGFKNKEVRIRKTHDIDIFIIDLSVEKLKVVNDIIINNGGFIKTDTLRFKEYIYQALDIKIQIIKRSYTSVSQILNSFDMPPTRAAYHNGNFYVTPDWLLALETNAFTVNHKMNGKTYLSRLQKYLQKGYDIYFPYACNLNTSSIIVENNLLVTTCTISNAAEYEALEPAKHKYYFRTALYMCLHGNLSEMYKTRPYPAALDDKFKIYAMRQKGKIISELEFKNLYKEYCEAIAKRNDEISYSFVPACNGRSVTENNNPDMTVSQFINSLHNGLENYSLRGVELYLHIYRNVIPEHAIIRIVNGRIVMQLKKITLCFHTVQIGNIVKLIDKKNNVTISEKSIYSDMRKDDFCFEEYHSNYLKTLTYYKVISTVLLIYNRKTTVMSSLPRRLLLCNILNHIF